MSSGKASGRFAAILILIALTLCTIPFPAHAAVDPSPPQGPVKLIFIHHSTGQNWLADGNGGLGLELRENNYFVSDTNYGWGPDSIGDRTDIGHWWEWFRGTDSATYLSALYNESGQHSSYSRLTTDPGGENDVIMFKSCFPNSQLGGSADDPVPAISDNPLRGQSCGSQYHTVANAKGIYIDLLDYFQTRQDKLFVVIVTPPVQDPGNSANARALSNWLVNDWLKDYPLKNVLVFDFYNVLTTNGGDADTNDLGSQDGNHHRIWNGTVQHNSGAGSNVLAYPSAGGDDHPSRSGNLKATSEFVPLLNDAYHRWSNDSIPVDLSLWSKKIGCNSVEVEWNDIEASGYQLYYAEEGQPSISYGDMLDGDTFGMVLTDLKNGTDYELRLEALDGAEVIYSAELEVRTSEVYMVSLGWDLEDCGNQTGHILVNFEPGGEWEQIDSYIIYRSKDNSSFVRIIQTNDTTFSDYVATDRSANYEYRINANVSGQEVYLDEVDINVGPSGDLEDPDSTWVFVVLLLAVSSIALLAAFIWLRRG
jgi:hypothetical protein